MNELLAIESQAMSLTSIHSYIMLVLKTMAKMASISYSVFVLFLKILFIIYNLTALI